MIFTKEMAKKAAELEDGYIVTAANPNFLSEVNVHYRNGREAKNGDKVISFGFGGNNILSLGVLYDAVPGNDYCNGSIAPIQGQKEIACLCDCLHIDDLMVILAEKGLDKRPERK